jgi:L-fuconate dehydratase
VTKILGFETHDIRFPTSANLDGSDAMNTSPDYSAAYLVSRCRAARGAVSQPAPGTRARSGRPA